MKNKHPNAIAVLALGLAMAGLHLADLLLWTNADTGFATAGSVWLRYIPWLAALALLPARPPRGKICSILSPPPCCIIRRAAGGQHKSGAGYPAPLCVQFI